MKKYAITVRPVI